jgi:formylglycine-generating enzyme required for sulfatase activity
MCRRRWEWCADGKRGYGAEAAVNPLRSLETGALRVLRGGSWFFDARNCRSAFWDADDPGLCDDSFGFRCAGVQA